MTAVDLLAAAGRLRLSGIAVAESLTGGLLAAEIVSVPGASQLFRGGVVAYDTRIKHSVLGVDAALLAREGAVHPEVAEQLARGVAQRLGLPGAPVDLALSTTGIAGPDSPDGQPVGTVHLAALLRDRMRVQTFVFEGDRDDIRRRSVEAALRLGCDLLAEESPAGA